MDYWLFLLAGFVAGFVVGLLEVRRTAHRTPSVAKALQEVIHAFHQLDHASNPASTKETHRVRMSPDWPRFVLAVNDLSLTLGGGPLRAECGDRDPEVDFKAQKRGI